MNISIKLKRQNMDNEHENLAHIQNKGKLHHRFQFKTKNKSVGFIFHVFGFAALFFEFSLYSISGCIEYIMTKYILYNIRSLFSLATWCQLKVRWIFQPRSDESLSMDVMILWSC